VLERIRNCAEYAPIVLPEDYVVVGAEGGFNHPRANGGSANEGETEDREEIERGIWNLVWWRRVAYFASVVAALWLALFPIIHETTGTCQGSSCFLGPIIRGAEVVLPGFAAYWLDAFEIHSGTFLLAVVVLTALLLTGGWLQRTIRDQMRILWQARSQKEAVRHKRPQKGFILQWLLKFPRIYGYRWYRRFIRGVKKLIVLAAAIVMILLAAVGVIRIGFGMMSSSGWVCVKTPDSALTQGQAVTGKLESQALCQSTGYRVEKGKRYRITLNIDANWRDRELRPGPEGLDRDQASLLMSLATPIRRHFSEPWFKPIARIGSLWRDEYPLERVDYRVLPESDEKLVAEITPRASGELFLFVNDAVLPVPESMQLFYQNNGGTADFKVEPVVGGAP
jgi:hypothetical protein